MIRKLSIRKIFLIDGIGAVITLLMLTLVLVQYKDLVGMPVNILYVLGAIAGCFAVYSFSCYMSPQRHLPTLLLGIATANALYCLSTFVLVIYLWQKLSWLGIAYFLGEIALLIGLVWVERSSAMRHQFNS